jgi:shikimate dehydrogenase
VRDIVDRLGFRLEGCRLLLAGAGGAARGVLQPLLQAGVASIVIANRTVPRAAELARLSGDPRVFACGFEALGDAGPAGAGFDAIVNATSTGLEDTAPAIPDAAYRGLRLAYDMVYGAQPTRFMRHAQRLGCPKVSDGLGMLVEQAAESFLLWRGVRPRTDAVYARLRAEVGGA